MFNVHGWIRNLSCVGSLWAAVFGSLLPVRAQFIPYKGVTVQHRKEPKGGWGFPHYYWLNDHELAYVKQDSEGEQQYYKLDFVTGEELVLGGFTKIVKRTVDHWQFPDIFPSPDGKYLAWIGTDERDVDTLMVATKEGSIISRKTSTTKIRYPSWSTDSQSCFGFLENTESNFTVFKEIIAVNIKTPTLVKTYPIARKPAIQKNALSGYRGFSLRDIAPTWLPDFHFGNKNDIILISPIPGELPGDIQFDEYNLVDTTMPVATRILHLPAFGQFEYVSISPQGDMIVWKFHSKDEEFWISDKDGGYMKRIGKFSPEHNFKARYLFSDPDHLRWLPSGKGISFLDHEELYVIYLDARKVSE